MRGREGGGHRSDSGEGSRGPRKEGQCLSASCYFAQASSLYSCVSVGRTTCLQLRCQERFTKLSPSWMQELFPFKAYFADAPGTLFAGQGYEADLEKARGCWRHLRTMFQELEECRAFELLKVHCCAPFTLCLHVC